MHTDMTAKDLLEDYVVRRVVKSTTDISTNNMMHHLLRMKPQYIDGDNFNFHRFASYLSYRIKDTYTENIVLHPPLLIEY